MKKQSQISFIYIILTLLIPALLLGQSSSLNKDQISSFDWSILDKHLSNKRIVALGESLHGVKEYNEAKLEIIKHLHENLGFNIIALESDLAMNFIGNAYRDQIQDTLLLKHLITPVWHTHTHLKLIQYLKEKPELKLIGFDIVDIHSMDKAQQLLKLDQDSKPLVSSQFILHYNTIKPLYKSEDHFYDGHRDSIMYYNLEWILETLYPDEKIIISAANGHISKTKRSKIAYMGELLSKKYKEEYYSIGFFHSLGSPTHLYRDAFYSNEATELQENSLQKIMLVQPEEKKFIDVKNALNDPQYEWLDQNIRHILQTNKYEYDLHVSNSFDAIFWIRSVSAPTYIIESKFHWRYKK